MEAIGREMEAVGRQLERQANLADRKLRISDIDRRDRRELIEGLQAMGAFEARRAPAYVARILGVSRATIYNELSALRQDSAPA